VKAGGERGGRSVVEEDGERFWGKNKIKKLVLRNSVGEEIPQHLLGEWRVSALQNLPLSPVKMKNKENIKK
jgi:hypothetical protein